MRDVPECGSLAALKHRKEGRVQDPAFAHVGESDILGAASCVGA